ncbi:MAG: DEAD/DEAH box helicase [Cyclobacteriaceae bacterium]|nr:DEAD/DEAH box helicase [Cyclobacteriaceae bacterium]
MKVSTSNPFQIIYSLFEHEYLGYLFESFVVQLDDKGRLTLKHQNISSKNANEFASGLDETDFNLIALMDSMQQDMVIRKFYNGKIKPRDFFAKVYKSEKPDELLLAEIQKYLERRRSKVLKQIYGKLLFEMGNDGEPTWKQIEVLQPTSTILFHFRRNEDNTHYFPTIKYNDEKVEFYSKKSFIICKDPAFIVCDSKLYSFSKPVDGNKLVPFLKKKFIVVPKKVEDTYYRNFIAPLVAGFDVYAKGFDIKTERYEPVTKLMVSEIARNITPTPSLFDEPNGNSHNNDEIKLLFDISFDYNTYNFRTDNATEVSVKVEKDDTNYTFYRIIRKISEELRVIKLLRDLGLELKNSKCTLSQTCAVDWLSKNKAALDRENIILLQKNARDKRYFLGATSISVTISENIDWFDIQAIVRFGDYEIPFKNLCKAILRKENEIRLPNGEIGIIPKAWITEYSELFAFMDESKNNHNKLILKKHHLALVQDLKDRHQAQVTMSEKLEKLRDFNQIEDINMPATFKGDLRPYQKAGYNWLNFLNSYHFGGCLADDMGLGKTVQTLAMLLQMKENGEKNPSILILPTSLLYNWELEAAKFTPDLQVYNYTGSNRIKDVSQFYGYDIILTSYGIARLDIDILKKFYFNYVILDESQTIKNPNSNISKSVRKLNSKNRLILTGTPLENSTLDLWSQMSFVNPGLLGSHSFFLKEYLIPIEKQQNESKTKKLYAIIKPFIMRRHKSQVATELPEKVESVKYCTMTSEQEERYVEVKSAFRNKILEEIETRGVKKSSIVLLQGLTKLRQIANHPKMVDQAYEADSGKLDALKRMIKSAISENHKILVFSQFVKHLAIVSDYLKSKNIDYAYLDGSTKDRQAEVERFQNDDNLMLFLISLKAGGVGLNLTKAEYVFILDPWWNPAVEAQAIDRAHRIGQENKVFTYKFITKNTVEEKILTLQRRKMKLASELITTEESFVKDLSKEDIELLLE